MNIENMKVSELKSLIDALLGLGDTVSSELPQANNSSHWEIGEHYLIRTVTMYDTGKLVAITDKEIILEDAAWIPDVGRFSDAIKKCSFSEVEPFPDGRVIIGRGAVIDAVKINPFKRSQK